MDPDIRAALFDGFDDEGAFEELQDDFILQVLSEPDTPDFDFDAHIAKLIARSEQSLGVNNNKLNNQFKVRFINDNNDENTCDFDDEDEFSDAVIDDLINNQENLQYLSNNGKHSRITTTSAVQLLSPEEREALELQFEKTLEEYNDDEIGYLSELEEDEVAGTIDFENGDSSNNTVIYEIFEEYLQEQKDNLFIEGTKLKKGLRSSIQPNASVEDVGYELDMSQIDTKKELDEQEELQREYGEAVQDMISDSIVHDKEIETCQAYLQATRIEDDWDCETILSTYSTLDNHPTVIKDTNTKYRKYKNHYLKSLEALEQQQQSSLTLDNNTTGLPSIASNNSCNPSITSGKQVKYITNKSLSVLTIANELRNNVSNNKNKSDNMLTNTSTTNSNTSTSSSSTTTTSKPHPSVIVLSGKLNLPSCYGPSHFEKKKNMKPQRSLDCFNNDNKNALEVIDEIGEEDDDDNNDSSDINKTDDKHIKYIIRPKNETSQGKKIRKEKVKEERRMKRLNKKELKTIYKIEGNKIIHTVSKEQHIDHISVFKY